MTPREYEAEIRWMGWRALAMRAFDLRPSEAHALALLMRHAGRLVTVQALAAYDGDGLPNKKVFHTTPRAGNEAVRIRVARLVKKFEDCGCAGVIGRQGGLTGQPVTGFTIDVRNAAKIEAALAFACGVEAEAAA